MTFGNLFCSFELEFTLRVVPIEIFIICTYIRRGSVTLLDYL